MSSDESLVTVMQHGSALSLSDAAPAILKNYFNEYNNTFLTQHHIQTYESFIFREMLEIIQSENPITILKEPIDTDKGIYKYKTEIYIGGNKTNINELAIEVGAPTITLDHGKTVRRMFPNEARIRDLTYAANFQADILVRTTWTTVVDGVIQTKSRDLHFEKYKLFNIPILLRSKLCATYNATQDVLYEMGECRNDQGGYFIIDGSEKLLITRQEQAFNSIYVAVKPASDLKIATYASVICQDPKTKQSRRVALYRLRGNKHIEDGVIRISIPFVKGAIPLFVLFRALGVESDEEIVRMILPDTSLPSVSDMENTLIPSIQDAWPLTNQIQALEFIRTLTKGFIVSHVLNILHTHLFSHIPDRKLARAQYLAEIVRKMIRIEMRLEPPTNRDDIRNQRLLATGTLLRGLFLESWKLWKKSVRLEVDKLYNYNRMLYQDENFLNIFSVGNLSSVLSAKELNNSIMRGFRGRWGTNQYNMKSGVIQPVARISFLDTMSHTRRVISDFDTSMKLVGPRHLNPSQVGYFCTAETPTGAHIGATKNLSIMTSISISADPEPLMKWLFARGGVIEVGDSTSALCATATGVQINGGTIGFSTDPTTLTLVLKLLKWTACLPPTASISFNTAENSIRIYLDDGRPLRPLHHLTEGNWSATMTDFFKESQELPSWRNMVCGTYPLTADVPIHSAEFYDPFESRDSNTIHLIDYINELSNHAGCIEYVDPYEGNETYVSWWGRIDNLTPNHTHVEIHPSSLMGLLANMIPFANHNQSPRNQLSCSQSKQAIGYYATNYESRFDTYGSMLCYGEGALCRTIVHNAVGGGTMPYGTNIIFALCSFNGYNQDDGILFNRSSIERGLFRSLSLRSYTTVEEEDPITHAIYRIGNPRNILAWTDLKPGCDYSSLDENGIIREGTVIHDKTVLVARYLTNKETGHISDASLLPTVFTNGRIDKVVILNQANGMKLVRVRILQERVPELGDKFSSRHGQKGTIGMLLDAVDMPRTTDGMVPDVVVNPHCIPSRMTIAQLLEQVFGKFGAIIGAKMNATTFMNDDRSFNAIAGALQSVGLQREGEEIMYSGITGQMFTSSIFMGPLYFMRLKHLTQDKLNARSSGRKEIRTHQPTGGRGNEGGMRIGEMERDVLIAHGVTGFLQESMMKRSDGTFMWICNGCGTIPVYNEAIDLFICPMCDGPLTYQGNTIDTLGLVLPVKKSRTTFSRIEIPYALKLLDQELTTFMNGGFRFLTEKGSRKFQEPDEIGYDLLEDVKEDVPEVTQIVQIANLPMIDESDAAEEADDNDDVATPTPQPPVGIATIEFHSKSPKYSEFSTYYPVNLTIGGKTYPTLEHYFQAMKFPDNPEYQETIRLAKIPKQAKKLGKTEAYVSRPDWKTYRDEVMLTALREKFSDSHTDLKSILLETGNAFLKYDTDKDNYWGAGKSGVGQNKLGILLMQVRDEMRQISIGNNGAQTVSVDELMTKPIIAAQTAALVEPNTSNNTTVVIQQMPGVHTSVPTHPIEISVPNESVAPMEPVASTTTPMEPVASTTTPMEPVASTTTPMEPVASTTTPMEPPVLQVQELTPQNGGNAMLDEKDVKILTVHSIPLSNLKK